MSFTERRAEQLRAEAAHAIATAPCPTCQVLQTYPCRDDHGNELPDSRPVHPARYTEAGRPAA
ncbi:hypothetical protein [Streptomyces sp. XY533]|uniref:hypothetical protein n=1 Tax=Streptomyces sp. XY533 TaxID=1519481 RepID=UPI0006AED6C9|nr:hypothetical protein [Streptomyces sp. XY533]KOV07481.1 hypothetical protein ADK92_05530 [Streptomyces sp. XY533]